MMVNMMMVNMMMVSATVISATETHDSLQQMQECSQGVANMGPGTMFTSGQQQCKSKGFFCTGTLPWA
eukprot:CAMPEP_0202892502 /NCGR_PEP_ID=MMETSP1392-20130828/2223_1 /ASSEMBLY_ACC=CAM_ASM_000868 /TAXON_ID=225041 /ORGANISM="Chlamydomonas chlamydogama, Strain SAG 11-48b" /LENGTH=67 /DNA_ID=CAMNT_0049576485 /DNA_START=1 /DNA_END=200 /DNA_ORIENTATION=+